MVIRSGILHVPQIDADASAGVRRVLEQGGVHALVQVEQGVASQRNWIAEMLRTWCDEEELDLVLTIGGTLPAPGPSAAECVPEATLEILDRQMPGLSETMRAEAVSELPMAPLDRGVSGIRSRTLVVNLPEGTAAPIFLDAIVDLIQAVVAHLRGDPDAPRFPDSTETNPLDKTPEPEARAPGGLDAAEFAAYLARRKFGGA